jgi:hypothetical protein
MSSINDREGLFWAIPTARLSVVVHARLPGQEVKHGQPR